MVTFPTVVGQFAEFDQIMRSDPDSLRQMIARVQTWLIHTRWKKLIYGAISVQKCEWIYNIVYITQYTHECRCVGWQGFKTITLSERVKDVLSYLLL